MKALLTRQANRAIAKLFPGQAPVLVSVSTSYLRPVEMRRYIRNLRANRQYHWTDNFIY
jgi:hypothetical protein